MAYSLTHHPPNTVSQMEKPKESDWKKFRTLLVELREEYLEKKNKEIVLQLSDPTKTPTEQFWSALELMQKEKVILQECLDGYSRAKMWLHIFRMYDVGMMSDDVLNQFSEELQSRIREHARLFS